VGPLYYQYFPLPAYPTRIANWVAIGWLAGGVVVTIWMSMNRKQALLNAEKIWVPDDEDAPGAVPAPAPAS
jgi:hypothetical protein